MQRESICDLPVFCLKVRPKLGWLGWAVPKSSELVRDGGNDLENGLRSVRTSNIIFVQFISVTIQLPSSLILDYKMKI